MFPLRISCLRVYTTLTLTLTQQKSIVMFVLNPRLITVRLFVLCVFASVNASNRLGSVWHTEAGKHC